MLITYGVNFKMTTQNQKQVKRRNLTSPKTHGTIFSFSFTLPNISTEYVSKEAFERAEHGLKIIPEENIGTMEIMKSIRNHLHGTFPLIREFYGRYDRKTQRYMGVFSTASGQEIAKLRSMLEQFENLKCQFGRRIKGRISTKDKLLSSEKLFMQFVNFNKSTILDIDSLNIVSIDGNRFTSDWNKTFAHWTMFERKAAEEEKVDAQIGIIRSTAANNFLDNIQTRLKKHNTKTNIVSKNKAALHNNTNFKYGEISLDALIDVKSISDVEKLREIASMEVVLANEVNWNTFMKKSQNKKLAAKRLQQLGVGVAASVAA